MDNSTQQVHLSLLTSLLTSLNFNFNFNLNLRYKYYCPF